MVFTHESKRTIRATTTKSSQIENKIRQQSYATNKYKKRWQRSWAAQMGERRTFQQRDCSLMRKQGFVDAQTVWLLLPHLILIKHYQMLRLRKT